MGKIFKIKLTPIQIILLGFLGVIFIGALLLKIPFCTVKGEETSFLTALFTSTTSICVTGLVVVDTYSHWTILGKIIILILIQIGGFGVITFYSITMLMMHKRFSLKLRLLVQEYYNLDSIQGLIVFMKKVIYGTLIAEGIGAVLYSFIFIPQFGIIKGLGISIFNAVSAFCNAGMDIIGPNSLINYQTNIPINVITMTLIVVGGIGYVVWFDVINTAKKLWSKKIISPFSLYKKLNEHSRLVINITIVLIISGALLILILEYNNPATIGNMSIGNKIMASLFQSITLRTAGFATIPQESLNSSSCIVGLIYMFIGGSPVGTAGGVKTVTMFMIVLNAISYIRGRDEVVIFSRSVSHEMINKASAIVTVSVCVSFLFTVMLIANSHVRALSAAYEIISATGTVGLSLALTPTLNAAGRLIVIFSMFLGRIGPISMALFFTVNRPDKNDINYAKGHYIIG